MKTFNHLTGENLEQVAALLEQAGTEARLVAGGTDLLGVLKDEIHPRAPETLIDLKRIDGLDRLEQTDQGLEIGALVKVRTLEKDPRIRRDYPLLAQAAHSVASPELRNMGTLGGNLCQEPRCWYYRYPDDFFHCLRKGGESCPAFIGENRFHSIFGGALVAERPCTGRCPASVAVGDYLEQLRAGDRDGAAATLLESNPLPAVTGRVCPHFCQEGCNRSVLDQPVSIRAVERNLGDYILDHKDRFYRAPEKETGRSAAIVGSGPAGLAAAYYLRQRGHRVVIIDRLERPGGMLSQAIPAYRLPPAVVDRLILSWQDMGVEFRLGQAVGPARLKELRSEFEAVFAAPGAWSNPKINVPGEELTRPGLDFLTRLARGERPDPGRRVAVIGGGNVAVDVGLAAKRLGADQVTLVCLESRSEMPASAWEVAQAEEEGVRILPSQGPGRISRTKAGLTMDLVRCTAVFDDQGGFCPAYEEGVSGALEVDTVFLAVGQRAELGFLPPDLLNKRGLASVDAGTQQTREPGLLVGGDAVTGPGSVAGAIGSGVRAAAHLNRIWGFPDLNRDRPAHRLTFDGRAFEPAPAAVEKPEPPERRGLDREDTIGLGLEETLAEAGRCFNCGCVAVSPADIPPALIALEAVIRTTRREIPAEDFFRPGVGSSTVLEQGEIVIGVRLPRPVPGLKWGFEKYRIRQSIDFPIASVAVALWMEGGKTARARIALGAVSPEPYRAREAEQALEGRELNRETAVRAARAATARALPLAENGYKVDIVAALIERTIMAAAKA